MADSDEHNKRIQEALESGVPSLYFNGFINAFSQGDIMCVLERNGQPVGILNMSFTVAKTLSTSLGQLIANLENVSDRPIMTTHEIGNFLAAIPDDTKKNKPRPKRSKNV